jgi:hypothetical protein
MAQQTFPSASRASVVQPSRSRAPRPEELRQIPWLGRLDGVERERVVADLRVVSVEPGELVCRVGRPVTYWFGVIDGLLKMSNDSALGIPITFTGLSDYRHPLLEQKVGDTWQKIDQSVAGNDFWQCDINPATGTWEITFTILPDGGYQNVESLIQDPRTREFRFQVGTPPAK